MDFEMDEDILQDFLIEAGEILELLSEQLVDLEKSPNDEVLLNAIFRGFHTVKGGAGFLALHPLVDTCHGAENMFDTLRNGERSVTPELMDVILQVLDTVNEQFNAVKNRSSIPLADSALLEKMHLYSQPESSDEKTKSTQSIPSDEITEEEFDSLLDEQQAKIGNQTDEISEDEFEQLLNEYQSKNQDVTAQIDSTLAKNAKESQPQQAIKITNVKQIKQDGNKALSAIAQGDQTVRVNISTLDAIMNMIGELVLVRNRLMTLGAESGDDGMMKAVSNLDVVTSDLQNAVMKTRMQPIKKVFGRFPRVVRDLARSLQKEISLEMTGEDTDLDKNLVEALADPMVHLIRNSVDHGIEMPEVRKSKGKPSEGVIALSASQEGDNILLTIKDDGGGMDANKLRNIAIERGLMDKDAAQRLTESEAFNLIFAPGFSTKSEVSDISGRGVGMDVVKTAITQLNGTISIDSKLEEGTKILIKVPLTLAILPTLMVGVAGKPFALPLSNVNEIINFDSSKINTVNGQLTMLVREKAIPLFYMQDCLQLGSKRDKHEGHVVIIQLGHQNIALVVDSLIGQEEVVIKPLDEMLQGTPGMAGSTISSEGHIALILDISSLLKHHVTSSFRPFFN